MFEIMQVVEAGHPCPRCDTTGTSHEDLDLVGASKLALNAGTIASERTVVAFKMVASTHGLSKHTHTSSAATLRRFFKKTKQSKAAYFALEAKKIFGYPGGGFHVNGSSKVGDSCKIPPTICSALAYHLEETGSKWRFHWKTKTWTCDGKQVDECLDSESEGGADADHDD